MSDVIWKVKHSFSRIWEILYGLMWERCFLLCVCHMEFWILNFLLLVLTEGIYALDGKLFEFFKVEYLWKSTLNKTIKDVASGVSQSLILLTTFYFSHKIILKSIPFIHLLQNSVQTNDLEFISSKNELSECFHNKLMEISHKKVGKFHQRLLRDLGIEFQIIFSSNFSSFLNILYKCTISISIMLSALFWNVFSAVFKDQ